MSSTQAISLPLRGRIYIAGTYSRLPPPRIFRRKHIPAVDFKGCKLFFDNDPHFESSPPTWGICRPDLRKVLQPALYQEWVFFVLPKYAVSFDDSPLPQTIFAYLKVAGITDHGSAYQLFSDKHMTGLWPVDGNILVNANGAYNRWDGGIHRGREDTPYIIGDSEQPGRLPISEIRRLGATFPKLLQKVFNSRSNNLFSMLGGRHGRSLDANQTRKIIDWLGG